MGTGTAKLYLELLYHFQCSFCEHYWSIGDYKLPDKGVIYCPSCGLQNIIPQKAQIAKGVALPSPERLIMEGSIDSQAILESFASRLVHARSQRDWTQERLASECELELSEVIAMENAEKMPDSRTLLRMADELGFPIEWMLNG